MLTSSRSVWRLIANRHATCSPLQRHMHHARIHRTCKDHVARTCVGMAPDNSPATSARGVATTTATSQEDKPPQDTPPSNPPPTPSQPKRPPFPPLPRHDPDPHAWSQRIASLRGRLAGTGNLPTFRPPLPKQAESDAERSRHISKVNIANATREHINTYVYCGPEVMPPEAYNEWHQNKAYLEEGLRPVKGGCQAMQDEFALTKEQWLLYRDFTHTLIRAVANQSRKIIQIDGPTGCGKSIALVMLVAWARNNGHLVLYVPSAYKMMYDSVFTCRDGLLDTPDTAKQLLRGMEDAHAKQLKELADDEGKDADTRADAQRLLQLMREALESEESEAPVDAFLEVLDILRRFKGMPVLIAIDDYNTFWLKSEFFKPVGEAEDEFVDAVCDDIRVTKALRMLTGPVLDNGVIVAALSHSSRVSPKLMIPMLRTQDYEETYEDGTTATSTYVVGGVAMCPPFNYTEFLAVSLHYWSTVGPLVDNEYFTNDEFEVQMQRGYQLTQGDMRTFRKSVIIEIGSFTLDLVKKDKRRR